MTNRKARRAQGGAQQIPTILLDGKTVTVDEALKIAASHHGGYTYREAMKIHRLILQKYPNATQSLNDLGMMEFLHGRMDECVIMLRKAIRLKPDFYAAYSNLGYTLVSMGKMDEAETVLRQVLALKPDYVPALNVLVYMKKYTSTDNMETRSLLDLVAKGTAHISDSEHAYFALGKIYDDVNQYDEAFKYFAEANRLRNATVIYQPTERTSRINAIMQVFNKEYFAKHAIPGSPSEQPVFVVGMPRSGTTLLANVLSKHASVRAQGELQAMQEAAATLSALLGEPIAAQMPSYLPYISRMTPEIAEKLQEQYLTRLVRDVPADTPRIVDKHPLNFEHLGFISTLFPKAKVIHCIRNPLDTALSNYFQCFNRTYTYSFDLKNIGHYYNEYNRLMEHWRNVLPTPMLDVHYEELTKDTETQARKLIDFIGLPWDEACLSPHTNSRVVKTASMWQVRQPIYTKSVARWQHYEKYLGPLKEVLK